jgi:regulatory Fis family protein
MLADRERELAQHEREIIEAALTACQGQVAGPSGAAAKLGIPRQTLESKIKSLRIDKHRFKARHAIYGTTRRFGHRPAIRTGAPTPSCAPFWKWLARIGATIAAILIPGPVRSLTSKNNVRCHAPQTF